MANPETPSSSPEVTSLENLVITYDMRKLLADAREELENAYSNRELLGQQAISTFFNLEDPNNARN